MTAADDRGPAIARALGAGRYLVSAGTLTLTLDEAADLASRLRMLERATRDDDGALALLDETRDEHRRGLERAMRAEVLDVLTGYRDAERLTDAIVARLAGLWVDLD